MTSETTLLDATDVARLVRTGQADPAEVVAEAVRRVERLNPALNAVVALDGDRAVELARRVDRDLPLAGVPFLVKDSHPASGLPCGHGSRFRAGAVATADHPLVAAYRRLGAVPIGVTNMPEAGLLATTEPAAYGPCRNPWDLARTTGGSSGGSAAAVAVGMTPLATASDGGGSIRIPSSACGVFGLKPTRGRTPGSGWGGLSVDHVITRTVRDSALLLEAAARLTPAWPGALDPGDLCFSTAVDREPPRLRVALSTTGREGVRFAPEVVEGLRRTVDLLEGLGHVVEEAEPDLTALDLSEVAAGVDVLVKAAVARQFREWEQLVGRPMTDDDAEPLTWLYARGGRETRAEEVIAAQQLLVAVAEVVAPFYSRYDVHLLPTVAEPPPPNGVWSFPAGNPMHGWLRMVMFIPPLNTALANITGQPAMSLPLQTSEDGLPIGMQLSGRLGDERLLLALAAQLERAAPWADRRPPLS